MRKNLFKRRSLHCLTLCVWLLAGCGAVSVKGPAAGGREVQPGERFKLEKDEKVSVRGADLSVELKSVRRTWYVDGKSETADADLIITSGGSPRRQWVKVGGKVEAGGYVVEVVGANPFGKTDVTLVVSRG